jgi:hypothetical protein
MRRIKIGLAIAAFGAALSLHAGAAYAKDGMAAQRAQIAEQARASLAKDIEAYKAAHPEAFEALRNVKGHKPEVYRKLRNPIPTVGRELRRLGPSALLPMLEALAFEAPARGGATDQEWTALTVGMLEAVGVIRDPRSGPVLRAIFEGGSGIAEVVRAAAAGMGQLCGDAELSVLIKRSAAGDALRGAAIAGLGNCRRLDSAKHLAGLLQAASDEASAELLGKALGRVASSWAWKAMGPAVEREGASVREIAAKALVGGFVRFGGEARSEMRRGLLMTEHQATPELIARARPSVDAKTAAELDALSVQVSRASKR